jgi:2-methylcitrate dehydratase PrpD
MAVTRSGSIAEALAERVLAARWDDLPEAVQAAAVAVVFDALPVTAAGAREEASQIVRRYAEGYGATPHCTVIGGGFSTAAPLAALANGVAGHVLDYEPMWHPPTHPTSPVLPAALALAEWKGKSGAEVLAALVAGFEVQTRLLLASHDGALYAPGGSSGLHPPGA